MAFYVFFGILSLVLVSALLSPVYFSSKFLIDAAKYSKDVHIFCKTFGSCGGDLDYLLALSDDELAEKLLLFYKEAEAGTTPTGKGCRQNAKNVIEFYAENEEGETSLIGFVRKNKVMFNGKDLTEKVRNLCILLSKE